MGAAPDEVETLAFLHAHGIDAGPGQLAEMLAEAVESLPASIAAGLESAGIPTDEAARLAGAGFDLTPRDLGDRDPLAQTVVTYAALLDTALDVSEVATLLGVHESRVRQRLAARTLYGVRTRSRWRIPRFQLVNGRLIPGLEQVLPALDPDLPPVAVHRWLTTPNPDLALEVPGGGVEPVSPLAWLLRGERPEVVADLAEAL